MRHTLATSLIIITLATAGWVASSGRGSANHVWGNSAGPYHWARTANPFTLRVIDSTTPGWDGHRLQAQNDWSGSGVLDLAAGASDDRSTTRRRCPAVAGQVRVCNTTYGQNGWLGIASIWLNGNHITSGTVKNNDTYFSWASYNTPAWRQFVMCQEIGHTFGLGHVNENFNDANTGSCMDYTNNPARSDGSGDNLAPNPHDYDVLSQIYAHLDGTTTVAAGAMSSAAVPAAASSRGAGADDDPQDAVPAGANAGMGRVFTRELGGGRRVVSVVIWAADFPAAEASGRDAH